LAKILASVALLLPLAVGGAGAATAAPAAGYTAVLIPASTALYSVAVDPASDTVYFANLTDAVTVVDGSTNAITTTIPLPARPLGIAVDQVTDTVYVSLEAATSTSAPAVDVINGKTNTVTATITLPVGSVPDGVAVDSSTHTVYVAEYGAAAVAVIDGSANSVTTTVSTGSGTRPLELAVDETSDVVWVSEAHGNVLAISGASNTLTQTISLSGVAVAYVAVNPATNTVYVAEYGGVSVINGTTGTITTNISLTPRVTGVAVDQGSGTVFASSFSTTTSPGTTWVINDATGAVTDTIERGGAGVAVNTATGSVYEAADLAQHGAWVLTPSAVNAMSPVITSTAVATFDTGATNSFTVTASALPPATFSETGQLPPGVILSSAGILSGTPAVGDVGTYSITITAGNGIAPDYPQAFTLTVVELPSITTTSSATFEVGTAGSVPLQVAGNPPVTSVGVYADAPPWLSVTPTGSGSWELTGTPTAGSGGVDDVILFATSSAGTTYTTIPITVLEAPSITSATATTWLADGFDGFALSVHGYPVPTLTLTGNVPDGVAVFDPPNAQLQEEPPLGMGSIGVHQFTINATNSVGTASQAFTLTVRSPAAVGAEGSDGQLWVQAPQLPSGWQPLGGQIVAPPAVAAPPNNISQPEQPLFIATGSDTHLYIRSLTAGWQELGPATASCVGAPAAVITGTPHSGPFTLTVACRGSNNALWENSTALPASGLPQFTSAWTSLGGVLSAAPAAAPVNGTMTFFVRGTNGLIYTRTLTTGYSATPWSCIGAPAAAAVESTSITYVAFQGTDHALWEATNSGSGWAAPVQLGGSLIGGPAVAANGDEPYLLAEGTDHAVWQRGTFTGWSGLGGSVVGGVGAANLTI
jgi:YVTN family beta-propeller protein